MRWEGPAAPKEDEKKYTEGFGGEIWGKETVLKI
jgi:hypothetical protein